MAPLSASIWFSTCKYTHQAQAKSLWAICKLGIMLNGQGSKTPHFSIQKELWGQTCAWSPCLPAEGQWDHQSYGFRLWIWRRWLFYSFWWLFHCPIARLCLTPLPPAWSSSWSWARFSNSWSVNSRGLSPWSNKWVWISRSTRKIGCVCWSDSL